MRVSNSRGRMKYLPGALFPALISAIVSAPVFAGPAMDWMQKMSDAMRNLSYQGNFVYMHENQLESMRIWHYRDAQGEKERLVSLNGEAREVVRDNQNLTCIWPSSRKIVVDSSRKNSFSPIFIPKDIARLEQFYQLKLLGQDRVAGMDTMVVHIKPRDSYRYGLKFWISHDNGLMVKSSLINEKDREVEQVMFTSLRLFEPDEKLVVDSTPQVDEGYTLIRYHRGDSSGTTVASDDSWQLKGLPGGFWRESVLRRRLPDADSFEQQMVYTDGLASLSVFIEKHSSEKHRSETHHGGTSMGAVNAFIRIVENHSVTAIGEVPAITVKQVAEGISYQLQ